MAYEWDDPRSWEGLRPVHVGGRCTAGDHPRKYNINYCGGKAVYETTFEWDANNSVFDSACFLCEEHYNLFILKSIDDDVDVWIAPELEALHELQEIMTCL